MGHFSRATGTVQLNSASDQPGKKTNAPLNRKEKLRAYCPNIYFNIDQSLIHTTTVHSALERYVAYLYT